MKFYIYIIIILFSSIYSFSAIQFYIDTDVNYFGVIDGSTGFPQNLVLESYSTNINNNKTYVYSLLGTAENDTSTVPSAIDWFLNWYYNPAYTQITLYYVLQDTAIQGTGSITYDIVNGEATNFLLLGDIFVDPPTNEETGLLTFFNNFQIFIENTYNNFIQFITDKINEIKQFFENWLNEISLWLQGIWQHLKNIGEDINEGLLAVLAFIEDFPTILYDKIVQVLQYLFLPSPEKVATLRDINLYTKGNNDVTIFGIPKFVKESWDSASIGLPTGFGSTNFFGVTLNIPEIFFQGIATVGLGIRSLFGTMLFGFYIISLFKRYRIKFRM